MDEAVQGYIDGIDSAFRPLFDQVHALVMAAHPEAAVVLSYQMPAYKVGKRRLYVGTWQHGILYGWQQAAAGRGRPRRRRAPRPDPCRLG